MTDAPDPPDHEDLNEELLLAFRDVIARKFETSELVDDDQGDISG